MRCSIMTSLISIPQEWIHNADRLHELQIPARVDQPSLMSLVIETITRRCVRLHYLVPDSDVIVVAKILNTTRCRRRKNGGSLAFKPHHILVSNVGSVSYVFGILSALKDAKEFGVLAYSAVSPERGDTLYEGVLTLYRYRL